MPADSRNGDFKMMDKRLDPIGIGNYRKRNILG